MKKKLSIFMAVILAMIVTLTGCGGDSSGGATNTPEATATPAPTDAAETATPEPTPEAVDPFGKFDPSINVTAARILTAWMSFDEGEDLDNNWWMRTFRDQLGVNVEWSWTAPNWGEPYEQKVYMALATNDLPDYMCVYGSIFKRLVDAGKLEDLTEAYDKFASPYLKEMLEADNRLIIKGGTVDNKFLGIGVADNYKYPVVYIRKDWLDNLKLPIPTTFEELEATALAFATQDPDGNGKPDTYGYPVDKELRIDTFYEMMNVTRPGSWVEKDGQLLPGRIQEEEKIAWQRLADWYKQGILSPEFSIKDVNSELVQDLINGKVGIRVDGSMADPQMKDQHKTNPDSSWVAIAPPNINGGVVKAWQSSKVSDFNVATAGANTEVAIKMLNLILQCYHPTDKPAFVDSYDYQNTEQGSLSFFMPPFRIAPRVTEKEVKNILGLEYAVEDKDPSELSFEARYIYKELKAYLDGDQEYWNSWETFKKDGFDDLIWKYIDQGNIYFSPVYWLDTSADGEYGGNLSARYQEFMTKAIIENDVDNQWNAWVDYYMQNGGDKIIEENNAVYQAGK